MTENAPSAAVVIPLNFLLKRDVPKMTRDISAKYTICSFYRAGDSILILSCLTFPNMSLVFTTSIGVVNPAAKAPENDPQPAAS